LSFFNVNFVISFVMQRYNLTIKYPDQPLLVSKSKAKDLRAGVPETVYLVPELCRMTGLTDDMRSNFRLMSALAEHTRVGPNVRIQKLEMFSQRLRSEPTVSFCLHSPSISVKNLDS
jgi:aubergine-like protein